MQVGGGNKASQTLPSLHQHHVQHNAQQLPHQQHHQHLQTNDGRQNVLWNAEGGYGCMEPINQGGQQFTFPSQANTVCKPSVYTANGQVNSLKGGNRRKKRRYSSRKK